MGLEGRKKRCTLTIDVDILTAAQEVTDNLSETVNALLRQLVQSSKRDQLVKELKAYEREADVRRAKLGLLSDGHRKFL